MRIFTTTFIKRLSFTLLFPILTFSAITLPAAAHDDIDIVNLVKQNSAAVISVRGIVKPKFGARGGIKGEQIPFNEFFPFSPDLFERLQPRQQQPTVAAGSGFIVSTDGYVLTNAHVVKDADELVVTLSDNSEYSAKIVGSDEKTDIALLKIESDDPFPVVKIGDSETLQVGESVLAIGSPYGLDQSVTSGIISALGRRLPSEDFVPFIQTDAAVNPGNSGGPLLNKLGEVIGINSQIISPVRSFSGVSFAIPINVAIEVQDKLREHGVVRRGRLGVYFAPVSKDLAEAYGQKEPSGALIQDVVPNSPAEEAGLESGDILLTFEGKIIEDAIMLPRLVGNTEPGTKVTLGVLRDGEMVKVSVVLASLNDDAAPALLLGLELEDLTDEQRRRSGLKSGVVIVNIQRTAETPVGITRMRPGDVITHVLINKRRQQVQDRAALVNLLRDFDSGAIAFSVWREGRRLIIPVRIGASEQ
ncbi:MAG: Do family serine endopeptidase [Proteobacteria bacterium]|nr:Do family serine endopeptidase [Pseudomonadota bacterium]MCH9758159.1 Do family serine endopeptidase [Pseudomonadota bacterium]